MEILDVANKFNIDSLAIICTPYGCGHINDTYLVFCASGSRYILQRINNKIFRNVDQLMSNILGVTNYIAKKNVSIVSDEILSVIFTKDNKPFYQCEDGFFRVYNFISAGISIEGFPTNEQFVASAKGFGHFQNMLSDYDTNSLYDIIPNFHNTVGRYKNFCDAVNLDVKNRCQLVQSEINWFYEHKNWTNILVDLLDSGEIPYRVTHNDTKLNNVLIDINNMRPVCVIDLDTVMKGAIAYDFGDSIRTGANTGLEDDKDLNKVNFDIGKYRVFAEAFVNEFDNLCQKEIESMHYGAIIMTLENGMRFLTDYLSGDVYFKIKYPEHNLVRCRTQIKLVEEMLQNEKLMQDIVVSAYNKKI